MKSLFKKSWFIGASIIGLMVIVFFMNLWIMSLKLKSPFEGDSLWSLSSNLSDGDFMNIFAFILSLLFYLSIIPILLSGLSFLRKNNWGFVVAVTSLLGFVIALIIFQISFNDLSVFAIVLAILNIIFIVGIFVLLILRKRMLDLNSALQKENIRVNLKDTKIPLYILIIDIIAILVFLVTFFVPLYQIFESGTTYNAIIIRVLFSGDTNIAIIIYFLVNFAIFLGIFLYFASCLSSYFFDRDRFINKSKILVSFSFIATIMFFLMGLTMYMYYIIEGSLAQTFAFIPMLLMCIVIFAYAIFKGKYNAYYQISSESTTTKYSRIEPLFYVFMLSLVTVFMLFLKIIKIQVVSGAYTYSVDLTGIDILRDYASLDPGYRIVAYILVVMLISIGLALVISIASYLSKYKQFNQIIKLAAAVNVFFVFIIAISGYYFQIAKEINLIVMADLLNFYGVSIPNTVDFDYTITTDAIYALFASVLVLTAMFIRKAFDRDEMSLLETNLMNFNKPSDTHDSSSSNSKDDISDQPFDPCPAFTELDSKTSLFKQDLENRKTYKPNETTLYDLVHFVVEYAKNSRLHLSYTPEDIATFVAGLGASKLSILQGMSGTGKTSLPKIFSEAIFGNCEIIEVESSWKDKNELLGYYNEFSMKYTPKKFTLSLYKAVLNKEIFTFILLDEMNLSRIEYYFSDFLSLMENEENQRELKLINIKLNRKENDDAVEYLALENGNTLKVPPNVWFIGTANRDESTFVISDKVYDRSHTMNFTKRAPKIRNYTSPISKQFFDYQTMNKLFMTAKQKGNFDAENSELIKSVEALLAPYNISFGNRILKQIEEFVNIYKECFPNEDVESEAIEKILLSKVVAKLEVKTIDDKEKLEMEFEKLKLNQCAEFVRRLDNE